MRETGFLGSNLGFTLPSAMMMAALLGISALALMSVFTFIKSGEVKLNRSVQSDQILVDTGATLQALPFSKLLALCVNKGALETPREKCVATNGKLRTGAATQPGTDPDTGDEKIVEVLRNWSGDPSSTGTVCVDLALCSEKADKNILEATLKAYWVDPLSRKAVGIPKTLIIRRIKW